MTNLTTGTLTLTTHTAYENLGGAYSVYDDLYYRHTSGSETPNYHRRLRNGDLLPINHYLQIESTSTFTGNKTYKSYVDDGGSLGTLVNTFVQSSPNKSSFPDGALLRLDVATVLDHLQSSAIESVVKRSVVGLTSSKHDTLTSVAEFTKVVRMFRNLGPNLVRAIKHVKAGRISADELANIWLEGRYGWRTLMFDIQAVNEAIAEYNKVYDFYKSQSGLSHATSKTSYVSGHSVSHNLNVKVRLDVDTNYRGFAISKTTPPPFGGNVVSTAWEIIPYSFVIDWFLDVGDTIDYIIGTAFSDDYVSGYGTRSVATGTTSVSMGSQDKNPGLLLDTRWYVLTDIEAECETTCTVLTRDPYTPSYFPQYLERLNALKVTDMVALVYKALRGA